MEAREPAFALHQSQNSLLEVSPKLRNYLERIEFPSASQQLLGRLRSPQSSRHATSLLWGEVQARSDQPGLGLPGRGWKTQVHTSI